MKKFFLLSALILIFCLSQKSYAQNISDCSYRGFNLNYSLVNLVFKSKIYFFDIQKSRIITTLDDSLKFETSYSSSKGITLYCLNTLETFSFYWGNNKINKFWAENIDETYFKKRDEFYVYYCENERFFIPQLKSAVMFYCNKEGNGGFFKEDQNGSFTFKIDGPNKTFSPMDVKEIILFKERIVDLFIAIKTVQKK
jgi:hypothetical protein